MPRKLKTYQTSLGFFDLAIAAPSMKAALEAWGAQSNLFHQGIARETNDPAVVAATMAKPGFILKRPVGSNGPFREHADLPSHLPGEKRRPAKGHAKQKKAPPRQTNEKGARRAALAFENEQRRRERERQKEEAASRKEDQRRQRAAAKVKTSMDKAERDHNKRMRKIEAERAAIERRSVGGHAVGEAATQIRKYIAACKGVVDGSWSAVSKATNC